MALLGSAAFSVTTRPAKSQTPLTLRIGTLQGDSYAEPFFAADAGFFARAGIDPVFTILTNGNAIAQAILGNSLDVAVVDPLNVAHPVSAGVPFAFFAGSGLYSTNASAAAIVVAKDSPLRSAKDLEGKTVGVPGLATISALAVQSWLRLSGINRDHVSLVEIPLSTVVPALSRGTVAAAFLAEPYLTVSLKELRIFAKCYDAIGPAFLINSWCATTAWIAANKDLTRRLTSVIYDTARWANAHHAESAPIVSKYFKLELQTVLGMVRVPFATTLDPRLIQPVLDAAHAFGQLGKVDAATLIARSEP